MQIFALTVLGVLLAAVSSVLGDSWPYHLGIALGAGGTALSIVGAWLQYRTPKAFEASFSEHQWQPTEDGEFELHVPAIRHQRSRANAVSVFRKDGAGFELVICGIRHTESGGVVLGSCIKFAGKAVIT